MSNENENENSSLTDEIKKEIVDYDTLILSGGSVKGFLMLGAIQYLIDNYYLNNVKTFIGTSGGAIISYLLILGLTPIEIMVYICTNQLIERLQHFNIIAMINGNGALSFSSIYEQLEKMTIEKIGFLPTFLDLKERFNKELICTTFNLSENKIEYISSENYPNMPVLIALKMSSNLPLIFENFKYNNSFYIDGGVADNFPLDLGIEKGNKIIGLYIGNEINNFNNFVLDEMNIIEYIYKLMFIPIAQTISQKVDKNKDKCKIIKLVNRNITFFSFNINSVDKLNLFSEGYKQCKEQI